LCGIIFWFIIFRSTDSSVILSGSRGIAALGKILPEVSAICPEILKSLLPRAIEYCVVYLEHHMDSVRHATKSFLALLLTACKKGKLYFLRYLNKT
jgi:hypothetical protein